MVDKRCPRCKIFKPLTEYGTNPARSTGHTPYCKPCSRILSRELTDRLANTLLTERGNACEDCGITHENPRGFFEWHHIDPSTKEFYVAGYNKSLKRLRKEADKCALLCANCHKNRHLIPGLTRGELSKNNKGV